MRRSLVYATVLLVSAAVFVPRRTRKRRRRRCGGILAHMNEVASSGPFTPTGTRSAPTACLNGFATPSSGFSFTGACIRFRHSATNGTRATCIVQGSPAFKHQVETYGPQSKFGYKDFIPMFRAEQFDANAWVDLFAQRRRALRRSRGRALRRIRHVRLRRSTDGTPQRMGPKRDVVGELAAAARANAACISACPRTAPNTGGGTAAA